MNTPLEQEITHHLLRRGVAPAGTERDLLQRAVEEIVGLREELARRSVWTGDGLLVALFEASAASADHFAVDSDGTGHFFAGPPTMDYEHRCHEGRVVAGPCLKMELTEKAAWKRLCWPKPRMGGGPSLALELLAEAQAARLDFGGEPLVRFDAKGQEMA